MDGLDHRLRDLSDIHMPTLLSTFVSRGRCIAKSSQTALVADMQLLAGWRCAENYPLLDTQNRVVSVAEVLVVELRRMDDGCSDVQKASPSVRQP